MMSETAIVAFTTFFATIGPIDVTAMYIAMTATATDNEKKSMAKKGILIATIILIGFALVGDIILTSLGISLAALKTAGGILLLLIGIEMSFAKSSGIVSNMKANEVSAITIQDDISVFPLATPLVAGPGSMGAVILLIGNTEGDWLLQGIVVAALLSVLLITLAGLLLASKVQHVFGMTGMGIISRIFGILLCALAVQFIFDGLAESGLLVGNLPSHISKES